MQNVLQSPVNSTTLFVPWTFCYNFSVFINFGNCLKDYSMSLININHLSINKCPFFDKSKTIVKQGTVIRHAALHSYTSMHPHETQGPSLG